MHSEIELVNRKLEECFHRQRAYLANKPAGYLEDLKHECQAVATSSPSNLLRTAAVINQAACEVILEEKAQQ